MCLVNAISKIDGSASKIQSKNNNENNSKLETAGKNIGKDEMNKIEKIQLANISIIRWQS